jgi:hypothetical protein
VQTKLIAALLVAVSAAVAAPAFASGYGPAPFYHPSTGAPASQRGQSEQTVTAERSSSDNASANTAFGGVASGSSESGSHFVAESSRGLYQGH